MVARQWLDQRRQDLRVYRHSWRLQVRGAMSTRGAFVIQLVGIALYNSAQIAAWLFLFHAFGMIHGWQARDLVGLMGINMLVFGGVMLASVGVMELPRHVDRGSLDSLLTKPAPLVLQLAGGAIDLTNIGDLLLGAGLVAWYLATGPLGGAQLAWFGLALAVSAAVFWCFALLLPSLLALYVTDGTRIGARAGLFILDSSSYPTGVLSGPLRAMLLTVVPGLLIGAVPLEALRSLSWPPVLLGLGVAIVWLAISLWWLGRALRRYESSNLIGAR